MTFTYRKLTFSTQRDEVGGLGFLAHCEQCLTVVWIEDAGFEGEEHIKGFADFLQLECEDCKKGGANVTA